MTHPGHAGSRRVGRALAVSVAIASATGCGGAAASSAVGEVRVTARAQLTAVRPTEAPRDGGARALREPEDAARRVLFDWLDAVLARDAQRLRRLIVAQPVNVHGLREGRAPTVVPSHREAIIARLLSRQERVRLPDDLGIRDLIDPRAVEVARTSAVFGGLELPTGLEPSDLVLRFHVDESVARMLRHIATEEGRGAIIVRVQPSGASIIGL